MTHDDFRRIALGMKDAVEGAHMGHPDFRVGNRIFATLHADNEWGMVNLTPEQQQRFMEEAPTAFVPVKGAWGLLGCTAADFSTRLRHACFMASPTRSSSTTSSRTAVHP